MNIIKKNWWLNIVGSSNYTNVQNVLDASSDSPNAAGITALNNFFESIASYLSLAESIKIYAHKNTTLTDFQLYNYINPASNKTTVTGATYLDNGYRSTGAGSYILENINSNRRAGIESDYSMLVSTYSTDTTDQSLMYIAGASTSGSNRTYLITKIAGVMSALGYNGSQFSNGSSTPNHDGFYSVCSQVGGTLSRCGKDGTFGNSGVNAVAPTGLADYNHATCAWNNNGSVIRNNTVATAEFVWHGYELTDTQVNAIRTAWEAYKTELSLS